MLKANIIILLSAVLFVAMVLNLALKPKYYARLIGIMMAVSVTGGLIFYGYGFTLVLRDPLQAVFRTAFAVGNMFLGKNEISVVSSTEWFTHTWVLSAFWLCHLAAFYTTASAAFVTIGNETMTRLRAFLVRRGRLVVVYGSGDNALTVAKTLEGSAGVSLVCVTEKPETAGKLSALVRSDRTALDASGSFWRSVGAGKNRIIEVYSLSADASKSMAFAQHTRAAFERMGIPSGHTSLSMMGWEENSELLQACGGTYGFGHVNMFDIPGLVARTAVLNCPPWEQIAFDEDGKAENGIHALIVGFGDKGQAMLKEITIASQFYGADYKAAVFSKDPESAMGYIGIEAPGLFTQYDISLHNGDGRSVAMYDYLQKNIDTVNYVTVCVGSGEISDEVAESIWRCLSRRGKKVPIVVCSAAGVRIMNSAGPESRFYPVLTPENLSGERLDRLPKLINQAYCAGNGLSAEENWANCDAFSRRSCRSTADRFPAMCKALGLSEADARQAWNPTEAQKENLGRHEHLRWNAFHYCSGFSRMTDEEWQQRAAAYRQQKAKNGSPSLRIGKNMAARTHACLISWEELKELDAKEMAVTGKCPEYQAMDIANVMMIPELLKEKNG